jgi:hypothetical protein
MPDPYRNARLVMATAPRKIFLTLDNDRKLAYDALLEARLVGGWLKQRGYDRTLLIAAMLILTDRKVSEHQRLHVARELSRAALD